MNITSVTRKRNVLKIEQWAFTLATKVLYTVALTAAFKPVEAKNTLPVKLGVLGVELATTHRTPPSVTFVNIFKTRTTTITVATYLLMKNR